jgi:hypothetical protein
MLSQNPTFLVALAIVTLPLMSGCANLNMAQKIEPPSKPHLVDFETKTKEMMNKSSAGWMFSGALSQMMDAVQGLPMMAVAGHNFKAGQNCLWNDGKPFTGLQVVVQGSAFSKGLIGQPQPASVTIRSEPGKSVINQSSGPFIMTGAYVYTATIPYITCEKVIDVDFDIMALREGEGDYEVTVGPIDSSTSPVTFKHPVSITESYSRYAERLPVANPSNAAEQTPAEPKTQYELQLQQSAAERNRQGQY